MNVAKMKSIPKRPVIIVGAGGHSKVLTEALLLSGYKILGYTDVKHKSVGKTYLGFPVLGDDKTIKTYHTNKIFLVNGIGSTSDLSLRRKVYESFYAEGYRFISVVHPSAVLSVDVVIEDGVQIMAGAVVQSGSNIGANTIVNTGAIIDHDSKIGSHVHIAPGVVLSGSVQVKDESHIGVGATIIQGLVIGEKVIVGAGAVVLKNVPNRTKVFGVPAKKME